MNIGEAVKALEEGKKLMRIQWDLSYLIKYGNSLVFKGIDDDIFQGIGSLTPCDILAHDWHIVEE